MAGGLLGQWAVGTRAAVARVAEAAAARAAGAVPARLLATAGDLVEVNAAGSPRSARVAEQLDEEFVAARRDRWLSA